MCRLREKNHCKYVMYLLSSRYYFPSGLRNLILLSLHTVIIAFYHILHSAVVVWLFIGESKSLIRLKLVFLSVADCWRWAPWWLLISLMKKTPLDMPHRFMARISEVTKSPFDARCVIKQASCLHCVATSGPRWDILIWFVNMNFHTSSIQDYVCNDCWFSM